MTIRNEELHNKIIEFIHEVDSERKNLVSPYIEIAKSNIKKIGKVFGFEKSFLEFCESLELSEPMLYQLPGYRSHFVHQLNVFLNGYLILNAMSDEQFKSTKQTITQRSKIENPDIFKIWFVTAMFHDTGYPLGKYGRVTQKFLGKLFDIEFNHIEPPIVNIISNRLVHEAFFRKGLDSLIESVAVWFGLGQSEKKILDQKIYELFLDKLSENLIAGLIFKKAAEVANLDEYIVNTAVSAIILDDERMWETLREDKVKTEISYVEHPLAFLLIYCDNIQEFGRPKSALSGQTTERRLVPPKIEDDFTVTRQTLSITKDKIYCQLTYRKKPEIWDKIVRPILTNMRGYWKAPRNLSFEISYMVEGREDEFDNLKFLEGSDKV